MFPFAVYFYRLQTLLSSLSWSGDLPPSIPMDGAAMFTTGRPTRPTNGQREKREESICGPALPRCE